MGWQPLVPDTVLSPDSILGPDGIWVADVDDGRDWETPSLDASTSLDGLDVEPLPPLDIEL